jgi:hypothetical protein
MVLLILRSGAFARVSKDELVDGMTLRDGSFAASSG